MSAPYRLRADLSSVSLGLMLFLLCSCEWKPPRRPVKIDMGQEEVDDKLRVTAEDAKRDSVHEAMDQGVSHAISGETMETPSDRETALVRDRKLENAKDTTHDAESKTVLNSLNLEDRLKAKDRLLTIDPEGPPLIHLKELTVAQGVISREPRGARRIFKDNEREVLAFLRVRNFERIQKVELSWIFQGEVIQRDRLKVGISPRWRTWSIFRFDRTLKRFGEWTLRVSTGEGKLLGEIHFIRRL